MEPANSVALPYDVYEKYRVRRYGSWEPRIIYVSHRQQKSWEANLMAALRIPPFLGTGGTYDMRGGQLS